MGLDCFVKRRGTGHSGPVPWRTMAATVEGVLRAAYYDGGEVAGDGSLWAWYRLLWRFAVIDTHGLFAAMNVFPRHVSNKCCRECRSWLEGAHVVSEECT